MSLMSVPCIQGDSGTVSSDTDTDDDIDSVASQLQKASPSKDTTHLTNGDTFQVHDASPQMSE